MSFTMSYSRTKTILKLSIPIIIIFTILANNVKTDLPVHCKREEIEGEWVFRINNDSFDPSLADFRSTCGHGFPDKIEKLESDVNFAFDDFRDLEIFLGKDYKIYDPISNEVRGKWTPVYNEGFIVYYDNSVFTAFMKYHLKPNLKNKIRKNAKAENHDYVSNCQKTMIGWFVKDEKENAKNWSCFFGFKKSIESEFNYLSQSRNKGFFNVNEVNYNSSNLPKKVLKPSRNFSAFRFFYFNKQTRKYDKENEESDNYNYDLEESISTQKKNNINNNNNNLNIKANGFLNDNNNIKDKNGFINLNFDLLDSLENNSFLEMKTQTASANQIKLKLEQFKYEEQSELINEINSNNLSWKAQMHDEFKGLSFMDLKMRLGLRDSKKERSLFEVNKSSRGKAANSRAKFKETSEDSNDSSKKNLLKNSKLNIPSKQNINININKNKIAFLTQNEEIHTKKQSKDLPSVLLSLSTQENETQTEETIFTTLNKSLENNNNNNNIEKDSSLRDKDGQQTHSFSEIAKHLNKELDEIDEKTLPKNWDWRNIGGISYVPEPRMQGNCGSCYVFSMITSLESRLRILTNNQDKTSFSRQFPISCNFYTEGCDGGYPILVAKFSSEFELIPESCFEYKPETSKCGDVCDYKKFQKKYFVSKYEYLGGFYGNTNEIEIMKELRARGPIPGNMTVPWSFSYYKSGIYSQNAIKKNAGNLSRTTMLDNHLSWSSVDHSILLVGYGEENGTKFWIGMNTWGRNWGENGFFRILRGENDCNIETMGDAARIAFKFR